MRIDPQEDRDAADLDSPYLHHDVLALHGHRDGQRRAGRVAHERGGQELGIRGHPVLVLPAAGVQPLPEVALVVHEPDGHERQVANSFGVVYTGVLPPVVPILPTPAPTTPVPTTPVPTTPAPTTPTTTP